VGRSRFRRSRSKCFAKVPSRQDIKTVIIESEAIYGMEVAKMKLWTQLEVMLATESLNGRKRTERGVLEDERQQPFKASNGVEMKLS